MAKKSKLFSNLIVLVGTDDQKLMELTQKGNQQAYEKLFNKYRDKIMNYINFMTKDKNKAEELTHDVFLKVYKNKEMYNPSNKFSTWLYSIAKYTTLDYLKKKKDVLLDDYKDPELEGSMVENVEDDEADIETSLIAKAEKEVLDKCLNNLKESQKQALALRTYSELSYDEISEVMETSVSSIKSLINRAKKALTECVKNCMEEDCEG